MLSCQSSPVSVAAFRRCLCCDDRFFCLIGPRHLIDLRLSRREPAKDDARCGRSRIAWTARPGLHCRRRPAMVGRPGRHDDLGFRFLSPAVAALSTFRASARASAKSMRSWRSSESVGSEVGIQVMPGLATGSGQTARKTTTKPAFSSFAAVGQYQAPSAVSITQLTPHRSVTKPKPLDQGCGPNSMIGVPPAASSS